MINKWYLRLLVAFWKILQKLEVKTYKSITKRRKEIEYDFQTYKPKTIGYYRFTLDDNDPGYIVSVQVANKPN